MSQKNSAEYIAFDKTMEGLLAVPYSELKRKLAAEKQAKEKKKKRPKTASSRVSSSGKKRVA